MVQSVEQSTRSGDTTELRQIGPYQLVEKVGEGGFGIVYRAEQLQPVRRRVAVKIIRPGMASAEIIARFEAERQALAMMEHPNIARVYDAGTTPEGLPYFVMEYVDGVPLTTYCDSHRLTVRDRLGLFAEVCDAVQHAHQKAILHRDLKPSNVLVTGVDGRPVPKVIDFGIAKALEISQEEVLQASLARTQAGMVVGTPQYMSPEQAGSVPDVDTRSDVYTLGIILHELLTGETPLSREDLKKVALDEVLRMIREVETRRPSSRLAPATDAIRESATTRQTEPSKLSHTLRGELDWIMLKALEKERERRYQSASLLAEDVRRYLRHEPVSAGPPQFRYRAMKFLRRNRGPVAAASLIALTLICGIAVSFWQRHEALLARDQARQETAKTQAAESLQQELLWGASRGDHVAALRLCVDGLWREGLAHLVRALELRQNNSLALVSSAQLGFGPSSHAWHPRQLIATGASNVCIAISPDSQILAVGSEDKTMRVTELATGRGISSTEFSAEILSMNFSADGRLIFAGCRDKTVRIVEVATGKEIRKTHFGGNNQALLASCFSDDAQFLAVGNYHSLRVVEATTGREFSETVFGSNDGRNAVRSICFTRDGRRLAVGSWQSVRVMELATGNEISKTELGVSVHSVSFSPDGRFLTAGCDDKTVRILDAATGREKRKVEFGSPVMVMAFSPDGQLLAAGSKDKTMRIMEMGTGVEIFKAEFSDLLYSIRFSPDGRFLAAGSRDKMVRIFEAPASREISRAEFDGPVMCVSFSPDGRYLAAGSKDETVRIYEAANGKEIASAKFGVPVGWLHFNSDGLSLMAGTAGNRSVSQRMDAQSGKLLDEALPNLGPLLVSPDGQFVAAVNYTQILIERAREDTTVEEKFVKGEHQGVQYQFTAICFSPDSRYIAAGCQDKSVRVIEVATGKEITRAHIGEQVTSVSFIPRGMFIAVGCMDGATHFIEAVTGKEITRTESGGAVTSVSFDPDGRFLATGSDDGSARIIEATTGVEISRLNLGAAVNAVNFSPDGRLLAVGCQDKTVRVYDATWFRKPDEHLAPAWLSALNFESGLRFQTAGQLSPLFIPISADNLMVAQSTVRTFISSDPPESASWQHAILVWSQMLPEERNTSPWTQEPIRVAVGRWLMQARTDTPTIRDCADQAPWHPLIPISLARLEPRPDDKMDAVLRESIMIRPTFLARLTLKRLGEVDAKLYGADVLAVYAAKAAEWMDELKLHEEAKEARAMQ